MLTHVVTKERVRIDASEAVLETDDAGECIVIYFESEASAEPLLCDVDALLTQRVYVVEHTMERLVASPDGLAHISLDEFLSRSRQAVVTSSVNGGSVAATFRLSIFETFGGDKSLRLGGR